MKSLFVGFDQVNDYLALVAQEGNRWYTAQSYSDGAIEWLQVREKPDYELVSVRDIPTPPRSNRDMAND